MICAVCEPVDMCRVRARSREPSAQRSAQRLPTPDPACTSLITPKIIRISQYSHTVHSSIRPLSRSPVP